jgi:hypothetical protein
MRDKFVFEGIPERLGENTEEVIKNFIQTELDISDEIDFHRLHRMGKQKAKKHRPIVAKFVLHKQREQVRRAAPEMLRNSLQVKGIPGSPWENTAKVVTDYFRNELKISDEIQLKRVHRVSHELTESSTDDHRTVILQLTNHKDKVKVIQAAPRITAEVPYGVNEQFPREIIERRKQLYPYYKAAKRQGQRATMIVDKLFVEGSLIHPQRATGLETMEVSADTQETQSNQRTSCRPAALNKSFWDRRIESCSASHL